MPFKLYVHGECPSAIEKTISVNETEFKLGTIGEAIETSGIPLEEIIVTIKIP